MAVYGKVYKKIYGNQRIREMSETAMWLFIYLITNRHTNLIGLYMIAPAFIKADLPWWSIKKIECALDELQKAEFVQYDEAHCLLLVPTWFEHNRLTSPNQQVKALAELSEIPKTSKLLPFFRKAIYSLDEEVHKLAYGIANAIPDAVPNAVANAVSNSVSVSVSGTGTVSGAVSSDGKAIGRLIGYFQERHLEEFEVKYIPVKGKDGKLIKELLEAYDQSEDFVKAIIDQLFSTKDQWIKHEAECSIGILRLKANKLVQELHKNKSGLSGFSPAGQTTITNLLEVLREREAK